MSNECHETYMPYVTFADFVNYYKNILRLRSISMKNEKPHYEKCDPFSKCFFPSFIFVRLYLFERVMAQKDVRRVNPAHFISSQSVPAKKAAYISQTYLEQVYQGNKYLMYA